MKLSQLFSIQSFTVAALFGSNAILAADEPKVAPTSEASASEKSASSDKLDNSPDDFKPESASVDFYAVMARHRETELVSGVISVNGNHETNDLPNCGFEPKLRTSASPIAQAVLSISNDRPLNQPIEAPSSVTTSQPASTRVADSSGLTGPLHIVLLARR